MASTKSDGRNGKFMIPVSTGVMQVVVSDGENWGPLPGEPWEHVSVSIIRSGKTLIPTWAEMCYVKSLFWKDDETVIQFHPPESEYVNDHPHVLHLWKPPYEVPTPPRATL